MDVIQLRRAILSIRIEMQYGICGTSEQEHEKKERVNILTLLLEMQLRGYSLPDGFLENNKNVENKLMWREKGLNSI